MKRKPISIFDIDGTLALCEHRIHILKDTSNSHRWNDFYLQCDKDKPNDPVIKMMDMLHTLGHEILLFSGRSDIARDKTIAWLIEHTHFTFQELETPGILVMRQEGDYTSDDELKESWLDSMLTVDRNRVYAVFDDRQRVVDMWRRKGLTCFQVADGNF